MQKKKSISTSTYYLNLINCFCMVTASYIFKRIIHLTLFESKSGSVEYFMCIYNDNNKINIFFCVYYTICNMFICIIWYYANTYSEYFFKLSLK